MKSEKVNSKCINCDEKSETSQGKEESYVRTPPSFAESFIPRCCLKYKKPKPKPKSKDIVF